MILTTKGLARASRAPNREPGKFSNLLSPITSKGKSNRRPQNKTTTASFPAFFSSHAHLKDGIWEKAPRCFVVAGGPSLRDFDWTMLNGELVIAVNRSFERCNPAAIYSMDTQYWRWTRDGQFGQGVVDKFNEYDGYKIWLRTRNPNAGVKGLVHMPLFTLHYFSLSLKDGLGGGSNSGFGALNLALCLGASPIYLLGYDMQGKNNQQAWWHDGYPIRRQRHSIYTSFIRKFEVGAELARKRARIVNLNPESALKCFEFGNTDDIKPLDRPLVVSFYTPGTTYEDLAKELKRDLCFFGFEYDILPIPNQGGWKRNTYYKAQFIRDMMDKHPGRSLLWLDVDAQILSYPNLLNGIKEDMAVHYRVDWPSKPHRHGVPELLNGTFLVRNNQRGRELIDRWVEENKKRFAIEPHAQKNLDVAAKAMGDKISIHKLPPEYCYIDSMLDVGAKPVINHRQASRYSKKEVGR